jgi:hypothetical protein
MYNFWEETSLRTRKELQYSFTAHTTHKDVHGQCRRSPFHMLHRIFRRVPLHYCPPLQDMHFMHSCILKLFISLMHWQTTYTPRVLCFINMDLTPGSRALLGKLILAQLVKKSFCHLKTPKILCHVHMSPTLLTWPTEWDKCSPHICTPVRTSLRFDLALLSYLWAGLSSGPQFCVHFSSLSSISYSFIGITVPVFGQHTYPTRLTKQLWIRQCNNSSPPLLMLMLQHVSVIRPSSGAWW